MLLQQYHVELITTYFDAIRAPKFSLLLELGVDIVTGTHPIFSLQTYT